MANSIPVTEYHADGTVTTTSFTMSSELEAMLEGARSEWKRLEEAGTPYWCIDDHEVDDPCAVWKEDGYDREDGLEIQYHHGVMCTCCGGYIQEG